MFIKEVIFRPAYDKRDPNPSKNYGIHGMDMLFLLKGKSGAVQFLVFTDWYLPHVDEELRTKGTLFGPTPADIGYHSYIPITEWQTPMGSCYALDGHDCYYDGSSLRADDAWKVFVSGGSVAIWAYLEDYYKEVFGHLESESSDSHDENSK